MPIQANSRFQMNMQLLEQHWQHNTQGLMLATPSNPTGTTIAADELAPMCECSRSYVSRLTLLPYVNHDELRLLSVKI